MPTLSGGTTSNFTGSHELTKRTGTKITFDTDEKWIRKDIEFTISARSASPAYTGGAINGSATGTYTNATTSDTNTSGVSVQAKATATRAAVTYNGAVDGWVTANSGATAFSGTSSAVNLTPQTKYITGVTVGTSKNFNITIPNGGTTPNLTLNFAVDSSGNVLVT